MSGSRLILMPAQKEALIKMENALSREIDEKIADAYAYFSGMRNNSRNRERLGNMAGEILAEYYRDGKILGFMLGCDLKNNTPVDIARRNIVLGAGWHLPIQGPVGFQYQNRALPTDTTPATKNDPPPTQQPAPKDQSNTKPQTYTARVVEIEALQYDAMNAQEIIAWAAKHKAVIVEIPNDRDGYRLLISTLEGGKVECRPGDFVIRGLKNEFYPCDPGVFVLKYEKADT